jgi:hypothetical protein
VKRSLNRFARDPVVYKCVTILRRAVTRGGKGLSSRRERHWKKIADLAREILEALGNSGYPRPAAGGFPEPSCEMSESGGGGVIARVHREVIREATDGEVAPGRGSGGENRKVLDPARNSRAAACFRRYAKLLLTAPSPVVSRPGFSGPRLGDVTRLRIDGRVLLRREYRRRTGTAVAICLDCSDSMGSAILEVAGVAGSMAEALKEAGGNVACWQFGREVRWVSVRKMRQVFLMGGTHTELAIRAARDWLLSQVEEKRILAVFTDGCPYHPQVCAAETRKCHRYGIKILAGAVNGCNRQRLLSSMPGAELFETGKSLECGFHQAICRISK